MRIRILGGGWYGCHIALALRGDGHDVELHESADRLFNGASGANPARLHQGFHYPRSRLTRAACQEHQAEFLARYGNLTRGVPVNLYGVAAEESLVDFGTFCQVLRGEIPFVPIDPADYGLRNLEGAVLTGERHIVVDAARAWFALELEGVVRFGVRPADFAAAEFDLTIDCTFCARDGAGVDRYEPCVVGLLEGPTDKAVTIMDGPFPSLYPWNEAQHLSSLSSALYTPLVPRSHPCRSYDEARGILDGYQRNRGELVGRVALMLESLARFWPAVGDLYRYAGHKLGIRAMPRSGADARLVDVVRTGPRELRVRAGKIDAIFHAERMVRELIA